MMSEQYKNAVLIRHDSFYHRKKIQDYVAVTKKQNHNHTVGLNREQNFQVFLTTTVILKMNTHDAHAARIELNVHFQL
jgi:hypothetical protein